MPYKNVISYKYIGCLGRRFVANTAGNVSYASVSVLIFNYMEQGIFLALCVYACVGKEGGGGWCYSTIVFFIGRLHTLWILNPQLTHPPYS